MVPEISFEGSNQTKVILPNITIYFSYTTPVAFWTKETGRVVSENVWSNTTGKFLNSLEPDKKKRVPNDEFNAKLEAACNGR